MASFFEQNSGLIISWFLDSGLKIIAILAAAYIVRVFGGRVIERVVRRAVPGSHFLSKEAEEKRENTLIQVFSQTLRVLVWFVAVLMILSEVGVAIGPLLAAAGIAGVALGFGGQYLIHDLITGLFLILENQYRVGDVVCFDGTCGLVESITLRVTVLRDLDGTVHHVPHGEIKKVSNMSKGFARVNINVGVSYSADLEHVIDVINRTGKELADNPEWKNFIMKPPQFLRVDEFADSAVVIKILGDVKPLKQWDVAGELRKRIKIAFDREGIEIPFPQRVIHTTKET